MSTILKSFSYSTAAWHLDRLVFDGTNLIIGKNTAGKSRTLDALNRVRLLIARGEGLEKTSGFETELVFADGEDEIKLALKISKNKVAREELSVNGKKIIHRNSRSAEIQKEKINPPADRFIMHVRRDTEKYPEIEKLIKWADNSIIRSFIDDRKPTQSELFDLVHEFTPDMKRHVVEMANKVGFPLVKFDTIDNILKGYSNLPAESKAKFKYIFFHEKGIGQPLLLQELSNGMRRTLQLLIMIEQLLLYKSNGDPVFIAIDDLGEGLDYSKPTGVGRLLFDICREHGMQLMATSNEEFMMNIVDIGEWNILVRKDQTVKSLNAANHPELFDEFRFSGLDNFDLFTSDVLNRAASNLFTEEE